MQGTTPLMCAVEGGHLETVNEMLKYEYLKLDITNNVSHLHIISY